MVKPRKRANTVDGGGRLVPLDDNPKTLLGMAKPSMSKVPAAARIYLALGMGDGATKYGPYNWREKSVSASVYIDALERHTMAWFDGEDIAEDSGKPHLAHAISCLAIIIDALENGNLIDDRPFKGPAADLIKKWTQDSAQESV